MSSNATLDQSLRHLKGEHLKSKGDQALKDGNHRTAYSRYTEALQLTPGKDLAKRLLSNRSLAYSRALKYEEALEDAEQVIRLAPSWDKGHYRRGCALLGLSLYPVAAIAFRNALKLSSDKNNPETSKKLRTAVKCMTRQQVASALLAVLQNLQAQGKLEAATAEVARTEELEEAAFSIIKQARHELPKELPYHDQYLRWLLAGPSIGEAYTQRAAFYAAAKCFLQARQDAGRAIQWFDAHGKDLRIETACAYLRLGEAYLAEPQHADQNAAEAVKAFARGLELDAGNPDLKEGSKQGRQLLSLEQLQQVQEDLRNEGCRSLSSSNACHREIEICLEFPLAAAKHFAGSARSSLSAAIRAAFGPELQQLELDWVKQLRPGLQLCFRGFTLGSRDRLTQLCSALEGYKNFGSAVQEQLGEGAVTEARLLEAVLHLGDSQASSIGIKKPEKSSKELWQIPRPKLEIAMPYKYYQLVTAEGRLVERQDKHPFCMSRVYYNRTERPGEVWAEDADASYRWRQSGSEVKVIALKVPRDVAARQLAVTLEPFFIRVAQKDTGEVFLEGRLERGIVPKDSTWMLGGGSGEDGCVLLLHKMNLELLQRHWLHSEMWWPKLFHGGPEIAWDDYEKDYTDLPAPILEAHAAVEAEREVNRQIEAGDRREQEKLKEQEERQRLRKLEELKAVKPKSFEEWAELQHELAACS